MMKKLNLFGKNKKRHWKVYFRKDNTVKVGEIKSERDTVINNAKRIFGDVEIVNIVRLG